MSGNSFLLDTNIIVYALKGLTIVKPYFEHKCYLSIISEIELLGISEISQKELSIRQAAVDFCTLIPLSNNIKEKAIKLKQHFKVKLPDAIIAATAIYEGLAFVTVE